MTATTSTKQRAPVLPTEHPHVTKAADMMGGQPCVAGQRIPVLFVYDLDLAGSSIDEIIAGYPTLTRAQVHDALSYAYDHPDEMAYWREQSRLRNVLKRSNMAYVEGRLIPRDLIDRYSIPPSAKVYTWETLPEELNE